MSRRAPWMSPAPPKVTVTHGVMSWGGKTRHEAEANRDEDLARRFAAYDKPPLLVPATGPEGVVVGVVFQCHDGYWGWYCHETWREYLHGPSWNSGRHSCQEAEYRMRRDLAQRVFDPVAALVGRDDSARMLAQGDTEGLRDHKGWVKFQVEYARARAEGLDDRAADRRAREVE